jgi:hypothetical protein
MSNLPEIGTVYVHLASGQRYQVHGTLLCKIGNEWVLSVRYRNHLHDEEFARPAEDFMTKFKPVSGGL